MDEHTRGCLAIRAERNTKSSNIIETLAGLTAVRGVPEHIRSDIPVLVDVRAESWPQQPLETL